LDWAIKREGKWRLTKYKESINMGKSIIRWFTFDILKTPHFTLVTILAIIIIIKL
jgi:hypothetical protein